MSLLFRNWPAISGQFIEMKDLYNWYLEWSCPFCTNSHFGITIRNEGQSPHVRRQAMLVRPYQNLVCTCRSINCLRVPVSGNVAMFTPLASHFTELNNKTAGILFQGILLDVFVLPKTHTAHSYNEVLYILLVDCNHTTGNRLSWEEFSKVKDVFLQVTNSVYCAGPLLL